MCWTTRACAQLKSSAMGGLVDRWMFGTVNWKKIAAQRPWEVDDDCVKPTCLEKSWTASLHSIFRWQWVLIFVYVYNITTLLRGGRTQNVSSIFQGVFEGGLENVYMSKVFWQLSPQKRHLGDVQRPILHLKGGSPKMYLTFWYGAPEK